MRKCRGKCITIHNLQLYCEIVNNKTIGLPFCFYQRHTYIVMLQFGSAQFFFLLLFVQCNHLIQTKQKDSIEVLKLLS